MRYAISHGFALVSKAHHGNVAQKQALPTHSGTHARQLGRVGSMEGSWAGTPVLLSGLLRYAFEAPLNS